MAALKETPRQKMISLMYLVLLALLALQVSSSIIFKFQFLNNSLESFVKDSEKRNRAKLASVAEHVTKRGNRPDELKLKEQSEQIAHKTDELLGYMESLKKTMIDKTGGYEKDGNLKGAQNETEIEVLMLGAAKNGKAYELKKKLNEYVDFMNGTQTLQFMPLALDGKEDAIFKNNPDQKSKDFAELNFGQSPLVAGLATLSELESRVSAMKSAALTAISERIGANDFTFDRLIPMVRPNSRVVVAGTKYDAQMFMTATSSSQKLKMQVDGQELLVDGSGIGRLSFTASGGNYAADGYAKKTWKGRITVQQPNGKDTTYTVSEEYLVAKPTIQVQSSVVKFLYKNCGNTLDVQVPALGADYNPSILATDASVEKGNRKGVVTIVPEKPESILKVTSNGIFIGEEKYKVRLVPLPRIEARVRNKIINAIQGVDKSDLRFLTLKAIPDKEFAESLPRDARYLVSSWKATLARRKSAVKQMDLRGESPNLSEIINEAVSGDRLVIEVVKVLRKNYKDQEEDVKVSETIIVPII